MTRTLTITYLRSLPLAELHVLRGALQKELALTQGDCRRDIWSSLQAVELTIRQRTPAGPRP